MNIEVIQGDLLKAEEQYICHQCNCVSTGSAGIALQIFTRFPYSDIYTERLDKGVKHNLDELFVRGDGKKERFVINMMSQYYPGRSMYPDSKKDGIARRESAFGNCLDKIANIPDLESVAFPWKIGCDLGGGNWTKYHRMIKEFAKENPNVKVKIYQNINVLKKRRD